MASKMRKIYNVNTRDFSDKLNVFTFTPLVFLRFPCAHVNQETETSHWIGYWCRNAYFIACPQQILFQQQRDLGDTSVLLFTYVYTHSQREKVWYFAGH